MVLGKSLAEVRAMPYNEWRGWWLYFLLEPPLTFEYFEQWFGTMTHAIYSVNSKKKISIRKFIRNLENMVLNRFSQHAAEKQREGWTETDKRKATAAAMAFFEQIVGKENVEYLDGNNDSSNRSS